MNKCETTLIFNDGKNCLTRTLEGFIQLQVGDSIDLPNVLDNSYEDIDTRVFIKGDRIIPGTYTVERVDRNYRETEGFVSGILKIEYSLLISE